MLQNRRNYTVMAVKTELLSPAGDFEKLTMAVNYGADSVYLSGKEFGMRASAACFTDENILKAVELCHTNGKKIYITCNTLPHEDEYSRLGPYLEFLQDAGVDGFIIADLGVFQKACKHAPNVAKHVSTQLGIVNSGTANFLYEMGAETVVLAREMSMNEIREFRTRIPKDLHVEAFVHGAMCVSFSGRCLLSNYLTGRDSNRGQCAQPCRWKYHLVEESRPGQYFEISEDKGTFIMNSNDMCMIEHIGDLIDAGVDTFKIEGRMKSAYYTACVTNAYRHAIDSVLEGKPVDKVWIDECNMVSHRPYCTGFFYGDPGQNYGTSSYTQDAEIVAVVESCDDEGNAILTQRNKFVSGEVLQLVSPDFEPITFTGENVPEDTAHAMAKFSLKLPRKCKKLSIVRRLKV